MPMKLNTSEAYQGNMQAAERIVRYCEQMGLSASADRSGLSASTYIEVEDEDATQTLRLRIADHEMKPTYEALHGTPDWQGKRHDWLAAIKFVAARFGVEPPKRIATRIARETAAAAVIVAPPATVEPWYMLGIYQSVPLDRAELEQAAHGKIEAKSATKRYYYLPSGQWLPRRGGSLAETARLALAEIDHAS